MDLQETILKGQDTNDYLDHIAWKGIVWPWLEKTKKLYQAWLVEIVLSHRPIETEDGRQITAEQCAAHIEAIDKLEKFFEIINRNHQKALEALEGRNFDEFLEGNFDE